MFCLFIQILIRPYILAILPQWRENTVSHMNVSSDEEGEDGRDDCYSCVSSEIDEIFKPHIHAMKLAPIRNGDIVEINHISEQCEIYIRSTANDESYVKLMKLQNSTVASQKKPSLLNPLKEGCVVLAKFHDDFSRAVVIDDETLELVDIGAKIKINRDEIHFITREAFEYDRMVLPVQLKLPLVLTHEHKSAVIESLIKLKFKRFKVIANGLKSAESIIPSTVVDLVHIGTNQSLTLKCAELIKSQSKSPIDELKQKRVNSDDVDLWIADNSPLDKGFICCVPVEDLILFSTRMGELEEFGRSTEKYVPHHQELCIVMHPDEQNNPVWYRGQFHQALANGRAQVGLIDFWTSAVVEMKNIRKFDSKFSHEILSFIAKIRNEEISMELLNEDMLQNYQYLQHVQVRLVGNSHEVYLPSAYFLVDENIEEQLLALED